MQKTYGAFNTDFGHSIKEHSESTEREDKTIEYVPKRGKSSKISSKNFSKVQQSILTTEHHEVNVVPANV